MIQKKIVASFWLSANEFPKNINCFEFNYISPLKTIKCLFLILQKNGSESKEELNLHNP